MFQGVRSDYFYDIVDIAHHWLGHQHYCRYYVFCWSEMLVWVPKLNYTKGSKITQNRIRNDSHSWARHSPLELVVRWRVLCSDVGQVSKDLGTVDGEAGEQDELLPGGAEQTGVVLYGKLAEEGELLDPGDLPKEQLIRQATQQGEQLHLCYLVSGIQEGDKKNNNNKTSVGWITGVVKCFSPDRYIQFLLYVSVVFFSIRQPQL